jgi:maltooligosyltrehalose trehalohydrolase
VNVRPGATPVGAPGTDFHVWAPRTHRVDVSLVDTGERVALCEASEGWFSAVVPCGPGTRYRYVLDGTAERADPASRYQPEGVHGPSAVVPLGDHEWRDHGFQPVPLCDAVLYELHVGTFTPAGTFAAAVAELDDLALLGITAVEVMPVAQFPGARNWGYDGVFPFAVQNTYGGPAAFQHFVDECHRRGLAVILDVVYNHLGPEGNVLPDFAPYLTDRYRTPWGPAVNLDGPGSDGVRNYLTANALQWFEDFHVDGLRLDAVHELVDRSARPFLAELAATVQERAETTGRAHWLIAESADNDPQVVSDPAVGGLGIHAQWNDDFHHAVHVALTGERSGYYGDYSGAADVARAMDQGFVYQGQRSRFRARRHGAPSARLEPSRFVVFTQNHDQVGNRADGERLSVLVDSARLRLAAALVSLSPGIPLLFMGEEYAETAPFAYFVDHGDPDLTEAVRRGRAAEHGRAEVDLLDPADPTTFDQSVLDRDLRHHGDHREIRLLYRSLFALRAAEPALRRSGRSWTTAHAEGDVVTLTRSHAGTTIVALFNLSADEAIGRLLVQRSKPCPWKELLSAASCPADDEHDEVRLHPWQFRVFRATADGGAP